MSENAELWSYPDGESQRITVTCWLRSHNIEFDEEKSTEELIQLYRDIECSKYK